ncbi:unnamed protein product [Effrenium voratum]|nr:unnamed protein product [Effrenium voratum]
MLSMFTFACRHELLWAEEAKAASTKTARRPSCQKAREKSGLARSNGHLLGSCSMHFLHTHTDTHLAVPCGRRMEGFEQAEGTKGVRKGGHHEVKVHLVQCGRCSMWTT